MNSLVSVIITTYNTDDNLKRAVDSVLSQTYDNVEVIVVDDNNPNTQGRLNAQNIIRSYDMKSSVRYIQHKKNKNGSAARNTGIRAAEGEYVAFLDDDDVYYPKRVEKCVKALFDNPHCDCVYTNVDIYSGEEMTRCIIADKSGFAWKDLVMNESFLGTGSNLFMRKSAMDEVGFFDEDFIRYQDIEYMLRFLWKHQITGIQESLVRKNVQNRNIPSYEKYRDTKLMFFEKFNWLMDALTDEEKNAVYSANYRMLFSLAVRNGGRKRVNQATKELKAVTKLTAKETFMSLFPSLWKLQFNIKNMLK